MALYLQIVAVVVTIILKLVHRAGSPSHWSVIQPPAMIQFSLRPKVSASWALLVPSFSVFLILFCQTSWTTASLSLEEKHFPSPDVPCQVIPKVKL